MNFPLHLYQTLESFSPQRNLYKRRRRKSFLQSLDEFPHSAIRVLHLYKVLCFQIEGQELLLFHQIHLDFQVESIGYFQRLVLLKKMTTKTFGK